MGWMGMWWLVIAIVVCIAAFLLLRSAVRGSGDGISESPERVLKRRYAQGEIDRQTYERMLDDLRK